MEIILISACPKMQEYVCSCVKALNMDCLSISVYGVESAIKYLEAGSPNSPLLVFYCAKLFGVKEFATIRNLCACLQQQGKLVAFGSGADTSQVLQLIRLGVSDYLDVKNGLEYELADLIERFGKQATGPINNSRIYTFFNSECNTDVSLLAANVATTFANKYDDCGLLDFQLQGGFQAQLLNASPRYTLHSIADKTQQLDAKMFDLLLVQLDSGLQILASPEPLANGQTYHYSAELIDRVLQFSRSKFSNITIDLGKCDTSIQTNIISQSDRVIVCLQPNILSLHRTINTIDFLAQENYPKSRISIVLNNSNVQNALPFSKLNEVLGQPVTHLLPCDIGSQTKSINLGEPMVRCVPQSKLSQKIESFAEELLFDQGTESRIQQSVFVPFISAARRLMQLF